MMNLSRIALFLLIIVIAQSCCKKNGGGTDPDYPVYSYTTAVVNPPDYFRVNYNVSTIGNKTCDIIFEENSVWTIKKLGNASVLYSVANADDVMSITSSETIGFKGGDSYLFSANNNQSLDISTYLVEFTKTSDDYDAFTPKF